MDIRIAKTDAEITACFPVMAVLRPHLDEAEFLAQVRRQENEGYQLVFVDHPDGVVAVAGFRTGENLAWGRFLYIDDLVTLPAYRSKGIGSRLLAWLRAHAINRGCRQLHLDSGLQRKDAHRFYEREGLSATGYHFAEDLV